MASGGFSSLLQMYMLLDFLSKSQVLLKEQEIVRVVVKPGVPPMGPHMGYILGYPLYWIAN